MGSQGSGTLELSLEDIQKFGEFVRNLIGDVRAIHSSRTKEVDLEIQAMSEEQLRGLPDGFAPFAVKVPVRETRQWPKQSTDLKSS